MALTWDDWKAREQAAQAETKRTALQSMYAQHGFTSGRKCGECKHLTTWHYASTFFKCALSRSAGRSGRPSTDWRKFWSACGAFEAGEGRDCYGAH